MSAPCSPPAHREATDSATSVPAGERWKVERDEHRARWIVMEPKPAELLGDVDLIVALEASLSIQSALADARAALLAAAPELRDVLAAMVAAIDRAPERECGAAVLEWARRLLARLEAA